MIICGRHTCLPHMIIFDDHYFRELNFCGPSVFAKNAKFIARKHLGLCGNLKNNFNLYSRGSTCIYYIVTGLGNIYSIINY